jgi:hypothetical protein
MRPKMLLGFFLFFLSGLFFNKSFGQPPTITSFSPNSGPVGTLITITGTNLNNPTSFTIGGVSAITVSNDGLQLVGMVMPGALTGSISIGTAGGAIVSATNFLIITTPYPSVQQGQKLVGTGNLGAAKQANKVAISADGNTAVVGGAEDNSNNGAIWMYKRTGNIWTQDGNKLVGSGNIGASYFGSSVSISADGKTVLVGGEIDNSGEGAVWVFTQNAGIWAQQGTKLVGTGNTSAAHQGHAVSISADGNTALVGGPNDNYLNISGADGAAWVFTRTGNSWAQVGNKLVGTGSTNPAFLGGAVAISGDGNTAFVSGILDGGGVIDGLPTVGAVWVFAKIGNCWTQQGNKLIGNGLLPGLKGSQGWSVALSADGNTGIIGGVGDLVDRTGAAWIFTRSAGVWTQQGNKLIGSGVLGAYANQGGSVGISADGNTAIVGGINDNNAEGAVWVYTRSGNVWSQQANKLIGTGNIGQAYQGISACLSADGTTAIVGGVADNTNQGAAWIFASDNSGGVGGGSGGGLESKSLGNAIVKRIYAKVQNNLNGPDDYHKMQKVVRRSVNEQTMGLGDVNALKLSNMMPDISSIGLIAYNSTPNDIVSITNAKEVLSTDFTSNQQCKAVAFATKTQGEIYDHTKPICDRLKGASLDNVETVRIAGFDFIKYTMHNEKGQLEYATSFSIGTKSGRPDFTVQSTWLLKDYVNEENMYNFQLWAATPELVTAMVTDVLNKVQNVAPIKKNSNALIPNTYILSGKREATNLNMIIANTGSSTSGYFLVEDKSNEDVTFTSSRKVPFTISQNGKSSVSIEMSDKYESTITMYVNNVIKDVVYISDGSWYADFNKGTTSVSNFMVTNDSKRVFTTEEYPVFRNVELKAISKDYFSIVKLLKGGGMGADVSAYKGIKFTASGGHSLHLVLVKNSITNWKNQYYTDITLDQDHKEYFVSFDKFISLGSQTKISATDISTIVFSVQTGNGSTNVINTTLSNISFTKEDLNYLASLELKEMQLFPNPVTGNRFSCNFVSGRAAILTLSITDASGRLVQSQQVNAVKGNNSIPITIFISNPGMHIVSLEGTQDKYQSKKLVVTKY